MLDILILGCRRLCTSMYFIAYQFCRSMKPCIHSMSEFKFNHLNHISQVFPCVLNISNRNTYTHTGYRYTQLNSQFKPFHKAATYLRAYSSMMSNQHHIHWLTPCPSQVSRWTHVWHENDVIGTLMRHKKKLLAYSIHSIVL